MLSRKMRTVKRLVDFVSTTIDTVSGTSITFPASVAGDIGVMIITPAAPTITGWTKIETGTAGSLFVKEMTAGETSATASSSVSIFQVSFFRGALLPTGSNSSVASGVSVDPNPPTTPITIEPRDAVYVAGITFGAPSVSSVPSGYTSIGYGTNTFSLGSAYKTDQSGTPNPGSFGWSPTAEADGFVLVLEKS